MLPLISIAVPAFVLYFLSTFLRKSKVADVAGKIIVITGASSGLGKACAILLASKGAKVLLCSRNVAALDKVKQEIISQKHTKDHRAVLEPIVFQLDLANTESISNVTEQILTEVGHVDVLINNGGLSYRGTVEETTLETHKRLMNVNYFGAVAMTTALLPSMLEYQSGHIVCVSSVQGKLGIPFRSAYGASKHACQAFFDTLRSEVTDKNIHVSVYCPGYIQTNLSVNALTGDGSKYGVLDDSTKNGMTALTAAERILQMIERREMEVLHADKLIKLCAYLRNFLPTAYAYVMLKRVRSVARKQKLL